MLKLSQAIAICSSMFCLWLSQVKAQTLYLVRHAEKLSGADPTLSACGQARAEALAEYFQAIPLQAVYATPYQRTQQTAAAVAKRQQLTVTSYHPAAPEQLKQQLSSANHTVLIVGHSNTVPALVKLFSEIDVAPLTEQDYAMLYQIDLSGQPTVLLRKQQFRCQPDTAAD
ncbi:phosphoglycerate mutase family protein [Alishewanella sp. SMS9]|nr:phosphoglycerate mutase family protein [Alishewanella sp. SMS9]